MKSHKFNSIKDDSEIPFPNLLKKICDALADFAYSSSQCKDKINNIPTFHSIKCYICTNNTTFPTNIQPTFLHVYNNKLLRKYIMEKR